MIHVRIHYFVAGGYVHCGHFSAKTEDQTHGKNGDLVFDIREWLEYKRMIEDVGVAFIEDKMAAP
jgi:hypothetical protein